MRKSERPPVDGRLIMRAVALRKQGMTQTQIASELGVVQGTISVILRRQGFGGKRIDGSVA